MKRSVQEIVELLVFGLIALLIGTGLLWLAGWIFDLVGVLFKFFAALIWSLLRFIVPVAVGAAIVYALVRLIQQQRGRSATEKSAPASDTAVSPSPENPPPPPLAEGTEGDAPAATPPPPQATTQTTSADEPLADGSEEGESHPRSSEVWTPPQPSPPTSSEPAEDPDRTGPPVSPEPAEEDATGSVLPADDAAPATEPLAEPTDDEWPVEGSDELDEDADDEHRS